MSFARTKVLQPRPRAGLLMARPRLEQALLAALDSHRALLVCAPAGYGKTAMLGRAIEQLPAGHAAAWVSLDEGDDLHRLLACLMAALEPFDPPWRTSPEGLMTAATRPGGNARQAVAAEIVNTLDACDVAHGVIVLDDLHHLHDEASIAFLDHWLQRMSPRWTVAMAARHEPPLRLARLRAAGELIDFGESQLRFARDEVRSLVAGAGIDAEAADALHARTAGWAAGLRLALNGARGGSAGSTIDRQAFDFLATEVLARIDPALREFLLLSCVLPELDAARCAFVTGIAQPARWLEQIERLGLFATVVEDDATPTLRLHELFREALQHRLRLERPDEWPLLLARAAEVEPDPVRRQALLLAAGRPEQAAQSLRAGGASMLITQGGIETLLGLCRQFPPEFAATSPELQHVAGMAKWTVWDARAAERHFTLADALFGARGDPVAAQIARGQRAITLIGLGRLGDAGALIASLFEQPLAGEARIVALLARTWHTMECGAFDAVAPCFEALVDALEERPSIDSWFYGVPPPRQTPCRGIEPALARWAAGAMAVAGDRPLPLRTSALHTRAWLALWQGRLDECGELLERAEADAQWVGQHVVARSHGLALRAMLAALRGERETALQAMRTRIGEHPDSYGDWGLWHLLFFACRVASACADAASLREWLQRLLALQPGLPDADAARLRPSQAMQGTLAALEGRRAQAIALWRAALEHEEQIDLLGQAGDVRARLALALAQEQQPQQAAAVLAPLLDKPEARPGGTLLAADALCALAALRWKELLDGRQQALLARWAESLQGRRDAACCAQLDADCAAPTARASAAEGPLSTRELEVLAQIADGASNKLIARSLDLSPHTVKRHVAHILGKLDLASRGQAAAWYHAEAAAALRRPR
ncbi:helix-turn-helix transcriptional regulator [Rivibacter subsaxonicus]|uniref:LuxR family maltose regulon positive regulatory protein n=1 Tax=Rivibacter subsaxonicus TaxID=457575 RepID=A0A4Q7W173_9BURK|nr:LuxR C-terminal-related transcriptional regulator [Rivibacter subsaxonicus]RZU02961.1 LuxR family maltose regulon positive regulatory protein [Rivibacter subsaxonicus]